MSTLSSLALVGGSLNFGEGSRTGCESERDRFLVGVSEGFIFFVEEVASWSSNPRSILCIGGSSGTLSFCISLHNFNVLLLSDPPVPQMSF